MSLTRCGVNSAALRWCWRRTLRRPGILGSPQENRRGFVQQILVRKDRCEYNVVEVSLKEGFVQPGKNRIVPTVFSIIIAITISSLILAQTPAGPIARFTAVSDNVSGAGDAIRVDLLKWSTEAEIEQFLAAWNLTAPAAAAAAGRGAAPPAAAAGAAPQGGRGAGRGGAGQAPAADGAGGAAPAADAGGGGRGGGRGGRGAGGGDAAAGGNAAAGGDAAAAAGGRGRGGAPDAAGGRGGGRGAAGAPEAPRETPESSLAGALQRGATMGILWTSEAAGYSIRMAHRLAQPDGSERIIFVTDRRLGSWSEQYWKPAGTAKPTDYPFTLIELRLNAKGEGEGKTSLTGKVIADTAAKTLALENYAALPVVLKTVKKR
jgi:hypothetical protein